MAKIKGQEKLEAQLKELQNLNTFQAQIDMAEVVYDESQRLVPVRTGNLKKSGEIIKEENNVQVVYNEDYSMDVEFGTYKMKPQPYLRPAIENTRRKIVEAAAVEIQKEIKEAL